MKYYIGETKDNWYVESESESEEDSKREWGEMDRAWQCQIPKDFIRSGESLLFNILFELFQYELIYNI